MAAESLFFDAALGTVTEENIDSASGFVVLVTPTPRCRAPSLFFLLAAFLCIFGVVGFLWNVLHVHYEGVHNIDIFSCASPSETANKVNSFDWDV